MNQKVSGESEAKAILKGKIRQIHAIGDEILNAYAIRLQQAEKKNISLAVHRYKETLAWYGDFLLGHKQFKKFGSGKSKHWKAEYFAIEPELKFTENIGDSCRFILGHFDSRKFCKGQVSGLARFTSQFYFHEHFLVRCIQRFNEKSISAIGSRVYPVIEWLILNNISLRKLSDSNYFVFRDFILVTEKLPKSKGLLFKTILKISMLTAEDERKFSAALQVLVNSAVDKYAAVITNANGVVVSQIPNPSGKSLLNSLSENTFWVQPLLTSPDIRFNG
ncbi:hypothetical protein [Shewanella sp.]|jgi:hypothetical protein|uniref:hypothetical protein n=1 Tax=Shewanella sp. TaxID=50422 RepID=UPI0040482946